MLHSSAGGPTPVTTFFEFTTKICNTIRRSRLTSVGDLDMSPLWDGKAPFWRHSGEHGLGKSP